MRLYRSVYRFLLFWLYLFGLIGLYLFWISDYGKKKTIVKTAHWLSLFGIIVGATVYIIMFTYAIILMYGMYIHRNKILKISNLSPIKRKYTEYPSKLKITRGNYNQILTNA